MDKPLYVKPADKPGPEGGSGHMIILAAIRVLVDHKANRKDWGKDADKKALEVLLKAFP